MSSSNQPPSFTQILVIGGGPGGSYAAAALAREGFDVVLLEATKFPRYHIGESMLPSLRPFLKFIDCENKVVKHGFCPKPGAAVKLNQLKREGYTDFVALDPNHGAWNVVRSEFDEILLNHAQECGVKVFQETKVTSLNFASPTPPPSPPTFGSILRPCAAKYILKSGEEGTIGFDYLVDASGRNGIMSTKYLQNRKMNSSLKNIACWSYWKNASTYMTGTNRHNAPYFEALTDESGWAWFIPLHNGTTSVGVVMNGEISSTKKSKGSKFSESHGTVHTLSDHYKEQLDKYAPHVKELLRDASIAEGAQVKSATDYSYSASHYSGDHFRLIGDAAAFIDPFFSSGVHLALTGAISAAATISSSIRGNVSEPQAAGYHDKKVGVAYTRFLIVVMGAYKQMKAQSTPVLSDVNEDNFDRAFDLLRPVIQGSSDVGKILTEDELQNTMDFCTNIFAPTDQEMHDDVSRRLDPSLLAPQAPIMSLQEVDKIVGDNDEDAKNVLRKVNARKPVYLMYSGTENFELEEINGYKVICKRGALGLVAA